MRIIPKIDIKGPNLVKGIHLEGLRAFGNPKKFVHKYYEDGADEIIIHDIVASLYERNNLYELISTSSKNMFVPLTAGGGVRNIKDVKKLLLSGADRVFLNTAAIKNPLILKKLINEYGSSTIVVSIEVAKVENYFCFKDFGREKTNLKFQDWLKKVQDFGPGEIIVTSIDRDGTKKGFDLRLTEICSKILKIPFMMNGGFGQISHIKELLNAGKPSAIVIGTSLHYKAIESLKSDLEISEGNYEYLKAQSQFNNQDNLIKKIKEVIKKYV